MLLKLNFKYHLCIMIKDDIFVPYLAQLKNLLKNLEGCFSFVKKTYFMMRNFRTKYIIKE